VLEDSAAAAAFDYDLLPKLADLLSDRAGWVAHVQQQHLHANQSQRIASQTPSSTAVLQQPGTLANHLLRLASPKAI
jgi:hypothetical protein